MGSILARLSAFLAIASAVIAAAAPARAEQGRLSQSEVARFMYDYAAAINGCNDAWMDAHTLPLSRFTFAMEGVEGRTLNKQEFLERFGRTCRTHMPHSQWQNEYRLEVDVWQAKAYRRTEEPAWVQNFANAVRVDAHGLAAVDHYLILVGGDNEVMIIEEQTIGIPHGVREIRPLTDSDDAH